MAEEILDSTKEAIDLLIENYALIDMSGSTYFLDMSNVRDVLTGNGDPTTNTLKFISLSDIKRKMRRFLLQSDIGIEQKEIDRAIQIWESHPSTTWYNGLDFDPKGTPDNVLNLWRPEAIAPVEGDFEIISDYLLKVLSGGDDEKYQYLLKYLAHAIQRPEEKPQIMLVFYGGQGTGKGTFIRLLEAIWPYTTVMIQDAGEVVGRFTGVMERSFFVCFDEAWFPGDKKIGAALKSKVSEPTIRVEEKMQPARSIKSCHRLIAVTNDRHFANTEHDDRRFCFFEISDIHKQDDEYFNPLRASFKDGKTLPAFVYHLKNLDLSNFNVRKRPITSEHMQQKIESLPPIYALIFEILDSGFFDNLTPIDLSKGAFITTEQFKDKYLEYYPNAQRYNAASEKFITTRIKEALPSVEQEQHRIDGKLRRGLRWPSLKVCRQDFEKYLDGRIPWADAQEVPKKPAISVTSVTDELEATFANTFDAHQEHISETEHLQ